MKSEPDKTAIVTGGNSGLGYHCAKTIAANPEWQVILACRNLDKAAKAVDRLNAISSNNNVEAMSLDLASLASVRRFAQALVAKDRPPLRALICNAGLQRVTGTTYTEDGFEATFGVNHLGHFLLVNLLLSQLVTPARIILVSSGTHDPARKTGMVAPQYRHPKCLAYPDLKATAGENSGTIGRRYYTTSKLCNVYCAYEFSRRLRSQGHSTPDHPIVVNAFDPGLMPGSGLARDYSWLQQFLWYFILPGLTVLSPYINTPPAAGRALARLALDPELETVSGQYFAGWQAIPSSKESYDEANAAELWDASAELVQLTLDETILTW